MVDPGRRILVSTPTEECGHGVLSDPVITGTKIVFWKLEGWIYYYYYYLPKKEKKEKKNFALLGDGTRDLAGFLSKVRQM